MKSDVTRKELLTARAAIDDAERVLRLWEELEPHEAKAALGKSVDALANLLARVESIEELRSPTWRLLYPEGDQLIFSNDWGEIGRLPTVVAVALARGSHLAWKTKVTDGSVEFEMEDGSEGAAPLTLLGALTPHQWPSRITGEEVGS